MKITITFELPNEGGSCDIQVSGEQRIADTLQTLAENLELFKEIKDTALVREKESGRKINPEAAYAQAHIYSGAELIIE